MYNNNSFVSQWMNSINNVLIECGQNEIWLIQGQGINPKWLKLFVKQTLTDQFINTWTAEISVSDKCTLYKTYKTKFGIEGYLLNVNENVYKSLVKYRTLNSKLPIEIGRYDGTERYQRLCKVCNLNVIGDEYHYIFECTNQDIREMRNRCLNVYYTKRPSMHKFVELMLSTSKNKMDAISLSKFVVKIMNVVK